MSWIDTATAPPRRCLRYFIGALRLLLAIPVLIVLAVCGYGHPTPEQEEFEEILQ